MGTVPKQLQKYVFKKGNKAAVGHGKSMKVYAREYLEKLPEEERIKFLNSLDSEIVWRMAEGNPATRLEGDPDKPLIVQIEQEVAEKYGISSSPKQNSKGQS